MKATPGYHLSATERKVDHDALKIKSFLSNKEIEAAGISNAHLYVMLFSRKPQKTHQRKRLEKCENYDSTSRDRAGTHQNAFFSTERQQKNQKNT